MLKGRKPMPTQLKVIMGNPGRRPLPKNEPYPGGVPIRPAWLRDARACELWDEILRFAHWLSVADGYKLAAWCDRQSNFEEHRKQWTAADRREHRTSGSELGLDPRPGRGSGLITKGLR